jgi:hypothetical protein
MEQRRVLSVSFNGVEGDIDAAGKHQRGSVTPFGGMEPRKRNDNVGVSTGYFYVEVTTGRLNKITELCDEKRAAAGRQGVLLADERRAQ